MKPTIIIGISGVGQRWSPNTDGIRDLVCEINALNLADVKANYYRWTVDRGELAANIRAKASIHADSRVILFGHSKGVSACATVAELYGRPVYALLSADGWNGIGDDAVLTIPPNVARLFSWKQEEYRPRGSRLLPNVNTLWLHREVVRGVKHMAMSKLPAFRDAVLTLAKGGTGDPRDNLDNVGL